MGTRIAEPLDMRGRTAEQLQTISELKCAADAFAERALEQELRRDRSRPGTGPHHQAAHSATLWRLAERTLRTRIQEIEFESRNLIAVG